MTKQLLTHSSTSTFKVCRKRYWFTYEIGLRRDIDAKALRMGSVYASALETNSSTDAAATVMQRYAHKPEPLDQHAWDLERETVAETASCYFWRWASPGIKYLAKEFSFELPLINPETGRASKTFRVAGKMDGVVVLEDTRNAVMENKLQSESLDAESDLWRRLRIDHQITMYVMAARRLGYDVATVLYDVARKPTITAGDVPLLDEDGMKIVMYTDGKRVHTNKGKPRQTGDKAKGYLLQTRPMAPEEWAEKLRNDIGRRPEWYYARTEIPRLDNDIAEFERELWDIAKVIRDAQLHDRFYRTCNRDTCSLCPYFELCSAKHDPRMDAVPEGFFITTNLHPELGDCNANSTIQTAAEVTGTGADIPF